MTVFLHDGSSTGGEGNPGRSLPSPTFLLWLGLGLGFEKFEIFHLLLISFQFSTPIWIYTLTWL